MLKTCIHCKLKRHTKYFNKRSSSKDGLDYICKDCAKVKRKRIYNNEELIDTVKAKSRLWKKANKAKVKNRRFLYLYGITLEHFNKMKVKQGGCCAICNKKPKTTLCVDHDHETGKVRGLLCGVCNRSLGLFQDDLDILRQAVKYLRKHKK